MAISAPSRRQASIPSSICSIGGSTSLSAGYACSGANVASRPSSTPTFPDIIYRASIEALEMALRFQVDWVLVISGMFFHPGRAGHAAASGDQDRGAVHRVAV